MITDTQKEAIWILETDASCLRLYQQTLGLQYELRSFADVASLKEALLDTSFPHVEPSLLIIDPAGSVESSKELFVSASASASIHPEGIFKLRKSIIVSAIDDLDLIRFFLKFGACDYILKPIHPSELIAKIERILQQDGNSEVLIMRNDLDGSQIDHLTFREQQILTVFLCRPGRSVNRNELFDAIWSKITVNRKTLDVHLFNLRRKLRPHGYDIVCANQVFTLSKTGMDIVANPAHA